MSSVGLYKVGLNFYVNLSRDYDQFKDCTCGVNDMKYGFN